MLFSQLVCLSGVVAIASAAPLQAAAGECKLRFPRINHYLYALKVFFYLTREF